MKGTERPTEQVGREPLESSEHDPRLLRSKLSPPLADSSIERNRIDEWLGSALHSRLALIHAPAGFGKTTVMLQLHARLQERGVPTAWLTLDEADNDVARFQAYVVGALRTIDPSLDGVAREGSPYGAGNGAGEHILRIRQWMTEEYGRPIALFLDDFEVVHNAEVLQIVRGLIAGSLPGQLLVVASRRTPDLGLARLRVRGQLCEIDLDDLRFAWDETDLFLRRCRGLELADYELARLYGCTEGWAAGLQLSALALTGRADKKALIESFSGSFADIADYLAEDVLSRQPEDVRRFLLETSVLDRLSGPLCDTVTGRSDSYELLSYLEQAHLFLMPLDKDRRWYRYHNLFSEFLRSQAERYLPEAVPDLHHLAADWFVDQGHAVEAAKHALAAGDLDRAAGLVAECAMTLVGLGQLRTVADWVDRLPSETLDRHPELRIALCWALSMRHRHAEARVVLDQIVQGLDPDHPADPTVLDQVYSLESVVLSLTDNVHECLELSERNLPLIADRESFPYGVLANCLGCRLLEAGRFDEARDLLESAEVCHSRGGNVFGAMYSVCLIGALDLLQGRLSVALERYQAAETTVRQASLTQSQTGAVAAVFLAEALYEMDRLDEAEQLLAESRDRFRECVPLDVMMLGYLTLARVHVVRGEEKAASRLLEEAELLGRERATPRVAATLRLEKIRLALQHGHVAEAEQLQQQSDEDSQVWRLFAGWGMPASDPETCEVSRVRLLTRSGQHARALALARTELARAGDTGHLRRALKLRILMAEALEGARDHRGALRTLREALFFGSQEGFVRTFADEGARVLRLAAELRSALAEEPPLAGTLTIDYLDRVLEAGATGSRAAHGLPVAATLGQGADAFEHVGEQPSEPLTARETEILEMVARGLSNSELADRLFVTVPTVKFHLRNINGKLRAHSRTRAVARARELGLIS